MTKVAAENGSGTNRATPQTGFLGVNTKVTNLGDISPVGGAITILKNMSLSMGRMTSHI